MRVTFGLAAILVIALLTTTTWQRQPVPAFGFAAASAHAEDARERFFLAVPSADRIRQTHRVLAGEPHLAGSPRDQQLAGYIRDRFAAAGLEAIETSTHDVLLPWPEETTVEMVAPRAWRASMREEPVDGNPPLQAGNPAYFGGRADNLDNAMARQVTVPAGSPTLAADLLWSTEVGFDSTVFQKVVDVEL